MWGFKDKTDKDMSSWWYFLIFLILCFSELMCIHCFWLIGLFHVDCCLAVCPPWCVTQQPACVCAAVWSCFTSWRWSILQQDTIWIRNTVLSSVVRPPPCLDTRSCCIDMDIIAGLIYYLTLICDWFSVHPQLTCYWSSIDLLMCIWSSFNLLLVNGWDAIDPVSPVLNM